MLSINGLNHDSILETDANIYLDGFSPEQLGHLRLITVDSSNKNSKGAGDIVQR